MPAEAPQATGPQAHSVVTPSWIKQLVNGSPASEGTEDVRGKACSAVTCWGRSVAKASETVDAAVVCHAPNKMSFFERLGGCQRLSETES